MSKQHEWQRDERTGKQRRVKVEPTPIRPLPPAKTAPETPPTPPPLNPAVEAALNSMGRAWVLIVGGEGAAAHRTSLVYWHDGLDPHSLTDMSIGAVELVREPERAHLAQVYALAAQAKDTETGGTDGVPEATREQEHTDATDD